MDLKKKPRQTTKSNPIRSMDLMDYYLWVWKYYGVWPPNGKANSSLLNQLIYHLCTKLLYGICLVVFTCCAFLNVFFVPDLQGVIDSLFVSSTCVMSLFKSYCVVSKRSRIEELVLLSDRMDEFVIDHKQRSIVQFALRESWTLQKMLTSLFFGSITLSFVQTLLGTNEILFGTTLMWPSWYPGIPWQTSKAWLWTMRLYQLICCYVLGYINSTLDMYGAALYKLLGAHLDVLSLRLSNIGRLGGVRKNDYRLACETELKESAKYHMLCIRFSELMDEITSAHFFVQFACSGITICVCIYKISQGNADIEMDPFVEKSMFLFLVEHVISMTIEIFIPCYFGTVVTVKSEQLPRSVFRSNWLGQSEQYHSSMRMITQRALSPILPMAWGLVGIGLPTFVAILRAAYSLLSMLNSMEQ